MDKIKIHEKVKNVFGNIQESLAQKENEKIKQAFLCDTNRSMSVSLKILRRQHHLFTMLSSCPTSINLKVSVDKEQENDKPMPKRNLEQRKQGNEHQVERLECYPLDNIQNPLKICLRKRPASLDNIKKLNQKDNVKRCTEEEAVVQRQMIIEEERKSLNGHNIKSFKKYFQYWKNEEQNDTGYPQGLYKKLSILREEDQEHLERSQEDSNNLNTSKKHKEFHRNSIKVDKYINEELQGYPPKYSFLSQGSVCEISKFKNRFSKPVFIIRKNFDFDNLFCFLKEAYFEDRFDQELLTKLSDLEIAVALKMLGFDSDQIKYILKHKTKEDINRLLYECLSGANSYENGKKLTNNKRFIFRKIRSIMIRQFLNEIGKEHVGKKEKDKLFFEHYFVNQSEFSKLTPRQRTDIKSLFSIYYENKIHILWRFKKFTNDFSSILSTFLPQVKDLYFKEALLSVKIYLEFLKTKSPNFILTSNSHLKRLPYNRKVVEGFINGFYDKFGDYLDI